MTSSTPAIPRHTAQARLEAQLGAATQRAEEANARTDRADTARAAADPVEVLADVETAIRRCVPFPHRTPCIDDVDNMLELRTAAADDAYQQLIAEHVDYA